MSILNDLEIGALCVGKTHFLRYNSGATRFTWLPDRIQTVGDLKDHPMGQGLESIERLDQPLDAPKTPLIFNFVGHQVRTQGQSDIVRQQEEPGFVSGPSDTSYDNRKVLSYGLSGHGYDVRLSREFRIFTNVNSSIIDPLNFDEKACLVEHIGNFCIIPPNSYILGFTPEWFSIPKDVQVVCVGKSTYARAGAIVNCTPVEAGFEGRVVIEIANSTNLPLKVYANQGIAQFLFFRSEEPCLTDYSVGGRKYQGQSGIVTPRG